MEKSIKEKVSQNLIHLRKKLKLTQKEFVDMVNSRLKLKGTEDELKLSTYQKYESGKNGLTVSALATLAKFHRCSMHSLVGIPDESKDVASAAAYIGLSVDAIYHLQSLCGHDTGDTFNEILSDVESAKHVGHIIFSIHNMRRLIEQRKDITSGVNEAASDYHFDESELKKSGKGKDQIEKELNSRHGDSIKNAKGWLTVNSYLIDKEKSNALAELSKIIGRIVPDFDDNKELISTSLNMLSFNAALDSTSMK